MIRMSDEADWTLNEGWITLLQRMHKSSLFRPVYHRSRDSGQITKQQGQIPVKDLHAAVIDGSVILISQGFSLTSQLSTYPTEYASHPKDLTVSPSTTLPRPNVPKTPGEGRSFLEHRC
jgi:hypothetical protein